jgi:hypothetical protein
MRGDLHTTCHRKGGLMSMYELFWSSTVWYILLFITSVVTLAFALKKSGYRKFTIAFTAATLGLVFYIESVVVIVLNAYAYHPGIVPGDPFQETVLGNMFSQVSISSSSALAIVYCLSFLWYVIIAFIYFCIDVLFVRLNIYEHYWYKSVYTLIGFIPLFLLIKLWYRKLVVSSKKALHNVTVLLGVNAVMAVLFTMPLKIARVQVFAIPFFEDASKSHTTTNLLYTLIIQPLFILIFSLKTHWRYKVLLLGVLFFLRYLLYHFGVITMIPGWFVPVTLVEFAGRYGLVALFNGFLKKKPPGIQV